MHSRCLANRAATTRGAHPHAQSGVESAAADLDLPNAIVIQSPPMSMTLVLILSEPNAECRVPSAALLHAERNARSDQNNCVSSERSAFSARVPSAER